MGTHHQVGLDGGQKVVDGAGAEAQLAHHAAATAQLHRVNTHARRGVFTQGMTDPIGMGSGLAFVVLQLTVAWCVVGSCGGVSEPGQRPRERPGSESR